MDTVARVRRICLALLESSERLWCPAAPGVQDELVDAEPDRFFVPPYVGPSGWIGLRLDVAPDWAEIAETVRQSYRLVAPKELAALLDP